MTTEAIDSKTLSATFTFVNRHGRFTVYKSDYGFPPGAFTFIHDSKELITARTESEIRARLETVIEKTKQADYDESGRIGEIRLTADKDAHVDTRYHYQIEEGDGGEPVVTTYGWYKRLPNGRFASGTDHTGLELIEIFRRGTLRNFVSWMFKGFKRRRTKRPDVPMTNG